MTTPRSYSTKHLVLGDSEQHAVAAALGAGALSGTAEVVRHYERALAGYFHTRHAVACSSGTAAIHLGLLALGVGPGDEVIVPATAPVMTALPVLAVGARPIFADVASPTSFALDLDDVARKRTRRTRAVLSVPMFGYPADGPELIAACHGWDLPLLEDAAQAHGARLGGRLLGTQGWLGTFSTHTRKLMTTGEGGFVLTDQPELAERLYQLRGLGQPARLDGATGIPQGRFGQAFGLNYKLAGPLAALGLCQLDRLAQRISARRAIATRLLAELERLPGLTGLPVAAGGEPNGYVLAVMVQGRAAAAVAARLAQAGVVSDTLRYGYQPLPTLPLFSGPDTPACPNAQALCASLLVLPCHEGLTGRDTDEIVRACRQALGA